MPPRALVDYSSDPDDEDDGREAGNAEAQGNDSNQAATGAAKRRRVDMPLLPSSVLQMPSLQRKIALKSVTSHSDSRGQAI